MAIYENTTVAGGGTTPSAFTKMKSGCQLLGVQPDAALDGTSMTFTHTLTEGGSAIPVRAVGGASVYSITVAASSYTPVSQEVFAGLEMIKPVLATQTGDTVVTMVMGRVLQP